VSGFADILADLNRAGVRYVLIGGIALIRHGVVRATRDVDAIIAPEPENLERLRGLISRWPATLPNGKPIPDEAIAPGRTIHLSTPHGDLDLLAERPSPLSFAELLARADTRRVDGVEAPICSLPDLVALKRIASRERDLVDLHDLEVAHGELPDSRGGAPDA
jgi:predicted nucleotidyltransferase